MTKLPEQLAEIAEKALKGDKEYLRSLFSAGVTASDENRYEDAAAIFKEAAICYRITAFGERAKREELDCRCDYLLRELEASRKSLEQHWQGLNYHDIRGMKFSRDEVRDVFLQEIWTESSWNTYFQMLASRWESHGVQFSSPGGSLQRKIIRLFWDLFECAERTPKHSQDTDHQHILDLLEDAESTSKHSEDKDHQDILIAIEPIFEEMKRRLMG